MTLLSGILVMVVAFIFVCQGPSKVLQHIFRGAIDAVSTLISIYTSAILWGATHYRVTRRAVGRFLGAAQHYQVECVFLIDRESGIEIEHVALAKESAIDSDVISAMFSVLQSFVQDAFTKDRSSRLTELTVGDYSISIAHGSNLMLVCVFIGDAPKMMKRELSQTLETIQRSYIRSLEDMGGREEVEGVANVMEGLMDVVEPVA